MVDKDITPEDALAQSIESRVKTDELVAEVTEKTEIVRTLRIENNWAPKIREAWRIGGSAA